MPSGVVHRGDTESGVVPDPVPSPHSHSSIRDECPLRNGTVVSLLVNGGDTDFSTGKQSARRSKPETVPARAEVVLDEFFKILAADDCHDIEIGAGCWSLAVRLERRAISSLSSSGQVGGRNMIC